MHVSDIDKVIALAAARAELQHHLDCLDDAVLRLTIGRARHARRKDKQVDRLVVNVDWTRGLFGYIEEALERKQATRSALVEQLTFGEDPHYEDADMAAALVPVVRRELLRRRKMVDAELERLGVSLALLQQADG